MKTQDVITVYKIRDAKTGLFSTGGVEPRWAKTGKAWPSRGALKSHLTQYQNPGIGEWKNGRLVYETRQVPLEWEVVAFCYRLDEQRTFSAREESERSSKR